MKYFLYSLLIFSPLPVFATVGFAEMPFVYGLIFILSQIIRIGFIIAIIYFTKSNIK